MSGTIRHVTEALTLRRYTTGLLTGARPGALPPDAEPESWRLFLEIERCATAIRELGTTPGGKASGLVDQFALTEAQRTLSARGHLAAISGLAAERGWSIVALKGSVAAAEGTSNYLADLDVLIAAGDAAAFAAALAEREGLRPGGPQSTRHLPALAGKTELPIEIHVSIDSPRTSFSSRAIRRIVPLQSIPGLYRLSPPDHLLHLLAHIVIDHPERCGRLRDTILLLRAWKQCTAAELNEVKLEVTGMPHATLLGEVLAWLGALASGDPHDAFEATAFARFWLLARARRPGRAAMAPGSIEVTVLQWTIVRVSGWRLGRWVRDAFRTPSTDRSYLGPIAWIEQRSPRTGRLVRLSLRAVHYGLAWVASAVWCRRALAAARRAGLRFNPR